MIKTFQSRLRRKFIPVTPINQCTNTLEVKCAFKRSERFRAKPNVLDMVVPSGMLTERGYSDLRLSWPTSPAQLVEFIS
ncbi:MAG: hypothetical protein EA377_08610 [Phycisphaerales bacterium]|nr:MAG: hypothetical protein EA377_08610 [Phycisphaerales bacterium]